MNDSTLPTQPCCGRPAVPEAGVAKLPAQINKTYKPVLSAGLSLLIAFFPKCPLCWAAYMSMLGSVGLSNVPYMKWLLPVLVVFLGLHLFLLLRKAKEKGYGPFFCSLVGALIIVGGRAGTSVSKPVLLAGMLCILLGSLWSNFSFNRLGKAGQAAAS